LETAKQNLRTEIGKITGVTADKVDGIFNKITAKISTVDELNKAVEILQKIKEASSKNPGTTEGNKAKGALSNYQTSDKKV